VGPVGAMPGAAGADSWAPVWALCMMPRAAGADLVT